MTQAELRQAAGTIERILTLTRDGTLDVSGPVQAGIVRRLEGAKLALQAILLPRAKPTRRSIPKSR